MKKIVALLLVLILMCAPVAGINVYADDTIRVTIDGAFLNFDVSPQIINDRTMVPLRAIFEALGAVVNWDSWTQTITAYDNQYIVTCSVGNSTMYVNNVAKMMDVAPMIVNNRTLVPARFVAEAFNCDVQWNGETRTVVIRSRTTMYAADGRTIVVYKDEVQAYKNVGWYETWEEAQAAKQTPAPTYTEPQYNPTADGYYYRTPTGKRYHLDPNCGGKNSYRTTNINGLTPCSKCAK